jgi:hypothetical protein
MDSSGARRDSGLGLGHLALVVVFAWASGSCATRSTSLAYHDLFPAPPLASPVYPGKVQLSPLSDQRVPRNDSAWVSALVIGLPILWWNEVKEKPEYSDDPESAFSGLRIEEEVALALADDLEARRVFEGVSFANRSDAITDARWQIVGTVRKTTVTTHYQGYLLPGTALWWLIGFPIGTIRYGFEIDLALRDLENGEVVHEGTAASKFESPLLFFYPVEFRGKEGRNVYSYYFAQALRDALRPFVDELIARRGS